MPDIGSFTSDNDARGLGLLFAEHRRAVLAYALRRMDDPADAADVLAEMFLVAWRRLNEVPAGAGAKPWRARRAPAVGGRRVGGGVVEHR